MVPSKIRLQKSVASFFHLTPHLLDLMKQGAILQVAFQRDLCVKEHLAVCVCVCRGGWLQGGRGESESRSVVSNSLWPHGL